MAAPFSSVSLNGPGLLLGGLAWNPFSPPNATFIVDGVGLVTNGFVWSSAAVWFAFFNPASVAWTGSSACITGC